MERRALFGLATAVLAAPAIGVPRVFPDYIEGYLKDASGRAMLARDIQTIFGRLSKQQEYARLRELILEIRERSGPRDTYDRAALETALLRCSA